MKITKVLQKGIEGAIIAGTTGASLAVSSEDLEAAKVTLITAAIGFIVNALKNWLKNRTK